MAGLSKLHVFGVTMETDNSTNQWTRLALVELQYFHYMSTAFDFCYESSKTVKDVCSTAFRYELFMYTVFNNSFMQYLWEWLLKKMSRGC